jgi:hypothetical protein
MKFRKWFYFFNRKLDGHIQLLPWIAWHTEVYRWREDYTFKRRGLCYNFWIACGWLGLYTGIGVEGNLS